MSRSFALIAILASFAATAHAQGYENSFYAKGAIGYGFGQKYRSIVNHNKAHFHGQGALGIIGLGMSFGNTFRTDVEIHANDGLEGKTTNAQNAEIKIKAKTLGAFVNGYYAFQTPLNFAPYAMAGIGVTSTKSSFRISSTTNSHALHHNNNGQFAWQLGIGASFDASDITKLDIGYRHINNGIKASFEDGSKYKTAGAHALVAGARFHF